MNLIGWMCLSVSVCLFVSIFVSIFDKICLMTFSVLVSVFVRIQWLSLSYSHLLSFFLLYFLKQFTLSHSFTHSGFHSSSYTCISGKIEKVSPCPSPEDAMSPIGLALPEAVQSTRYSDGVEQKHVISGAVTGGGGAAASHRSYNYQLQG